MPNKLISLLLAVCILFCLSACGITETSGNVTKTQSESQIDTAQNTEVDLIGTDNNNEVSSNSIYDEENDTAQTQVTTSQSQLTNTTNQPAHTHSYSDATCTSPKKCACGATAGIALGHQFSSATCTSPQICSRCGTTSGKALGHSYSPANCTSPKTCTRCGNTQGSALGHNYVNNKCSRCGKVDPDSLPVGLDKLHIISSSNNYKYDSGSSQDTYGNNYVGVHVFGYNYSGDAYANYNLNSQYKTFSGTIIASPGLDDGVYADYYIYVDDVLKYSKIQQERTTKRIDFKIDVSGGTKLTIKTKTYFKPGVVAVGYQGPACIANAQLTK